MLRLKRVTEGKQVGTLYHVCKCANALYNLKHDSITPGSTANKIRGEEAISFTRNKGYIVDTVTSRRPIIIQFVIDGDLLSDKYHIEPYSAGSEYGPGEAEEAVLGGIQNLRKYTAQINVLVNINGFTYLQSASVFALSPEVAECVRAIADSGIGTSIETVKVSGHRIGRVPEKAHGTFAIPTSSIRDLADYLEKACKYSGPAMSAASRDLLSEFFQGKGVQIQSKRGKDIEGDCISAVFNDDMPKISKVKKEIAALIKTIADEAESKKIIAVKKNGEKISRQSPHKIDTVLSNRTYSLYTIRVYPNMDYLYGSAPRVELGVYNSSGDYLEFAVLFPAGRG